MNEIQIFNHADFGEVRTIMENGNVLFCGSDVAKALGYSKRKTAEVVADNCYFGSTKSDSDSSNNNSGYSGNNTGYGNNRNGYGNNGTDYGGFAGGYDNSYGGGTYSPPQYGGDFAVIDDDDAQLPFDM